jgi:hypothetical protein
MSKFVSYAESQRLRLCPFCSEHVAGMREPVQDPSDLYVAYKCPAGHHFAIDERYDQDMPTLTAIAPCPQRDILQLLAD